MTRVIMRATTPNPSPCAALRDALLTESSLISISHGCVAGTVLCSVGAGGLPLIERQCKAGLGRA